MAEEQKSNRKPTTVADLVGRWVSDPLDAEGIEQFGRVSLEFRPEGTLVYISHGTASDEKMFLTFRLDGDVLVTDQPSAPREEQTRYSMDDNGRLTLWFQGLRSAYVRAE